MTPGELETVARALGGRRCGSGWSARCPVHDDHSPSLSLAIGTEGRLLVCCHAGCDGRDVLAELRRLGLLPDREGGPRRLAPAERLRAREEVARRETEREEERRAVALAIWHRARPVETGDPVDRYLRNRGLEPPADRWPASLRTGRDAGGPTLVAALAAWPSRRLVGVQATRLTPDGRKRPNADPIRRTLGRLRGAAVPIRWQGDRPIIIAEGVESALACAIAAPGDDVLACLGAHNAPNLEAPPEADVVLCLDADPAGERAAHAAASALTARGARVRIARLPPGLDPNDVLVQGPDHGATQ